jgi:hypothetical protein
MGQAVNVTPRPLYPRPRNPVRIVQEGVWVPRPVWTGGKKLPPQVFDPQTVQPVASRYTDYIIPAYPTRVTVVLINFFETPFNEVYVPLTH